MGDAGLRFELAELGQPSETAPPVSPQSVEKRVIDVLITGYGPFKSFTRNPSWLIASQLPKTIDTLGTNPSSFEPICQSTSMEPYRINIHVHSPALEVVYASVTEQVPGLVTWRPESSDGATESRPINYDYVLHIGLAGGRTNYTLETLAHRDSYRLKDNDDRDGSATSESIWRGDSTPEILHVGWHKEDVLHRWKQLTPALLKTARPQAMNMLGCASDRDSAKTEQVKLDLSSDAGRFLCEFILYASLCVRWKEAKVEEERKGQDDVKAAVSEAGRALETQVTNARRPLPIHDKGRMQEPASARRGKVAFLHVPNGVEDHQILKGTRVTIAAILALVGSWEDGFRNPEVYDTPS